MRLLGTTSVYVLDDRDLEEALAIVDRDPLTNVFVSSRLRQGGLDPGRLGAQVWGYTTRGRLRSLCYAGANLVPVGATREALRAFAGQARRQGRHCSSIVGDSEVVRELWELLEPHWGPARAVRATQPLMATSAAPAVEPESAVRRVRSDELDILVPACVAMFTEEVGVSPELGNDRGTLYRARIAELVRLGQAFAWIEGRGVVFKAEIGAVSPHACQVQGVWVRPDMRGQGVATRGMAAVVTEALRSIAPVVTLYVNDYNLRARMAYRQVGFAEVGTFTSVLF